MKPRRILRSLPLLVLLLGVPTAALGQLRTSEPLAPDARARLAQAAEDVRLAPWQRDVMLRLARAGVTAAPDSSAADPSATQQALAPGAADGVWGATALRPIARGFHSAIYDPVRQRMVVFGGGDNSSTYYGDLWALSLEGVPTWTQLTPTGTPPSARGVHSAIYDPVRDRMLIFGGSDGTVLYDDVWALSLAGTPAWTRLTPTGTPPSARDAHSAIYDPVRDRMVLFGGSSGWYLNDVWALSLAGTPAWTQLTPTGTPPVTRWGHSAIYDPLRDRMVVFGGYVMGGQEVNDVWALSLAGTPAWTQLTPTGTPPSGRCDHTAIYDPVRDRMVVFAGVNPFLNDVWALSLAGTPAWTQLTPAGTPASVRSSHSAIYDPVRDRMVVFAGIGETFSAVDDVWALSLADTPRWTLLTPPIARYCHSAIYDPVRDHMVVFAGIYKSSPYYLDDVWTLSLAGTPTWIQLTPAGTPPSARGYHTAIYDPVRDRMVLFGGSNGSYLDDVWALSLGDTPAWTQLTPTGTLPSGRCNHSAIYDPVRDRMVVFGGGGSARFNEVWTLSLAGTPAWTQLTPGGTPPSARAAHTAIYDPVRDCMVVFGGMSTTKLNDVWTLSLADTPIWTQLAPTGTPPTERYYHSAIYDPVRDRMVIFGGYFSSAFHNDVWALSLAGTQAWTQLAPAGTLPSARDAHSAIYDPVRDHMVVFGGSMGSGIYLGNYLNDVPVLGWDAIVPVQLSLLSAQADPDRVRLIWYAADGGAVTATVYRRAPEEEWAALGQVSSDGTGRLVYEDRAVSPGARYGYRLGVVDQGRMVFAGETWVEVPRVAGLALEGVRPNPATTALAVTFSLPDAAPARLEAFDLAGRRVAAREVGPLGGGSHEVELGEGRALAPGIYLLRLTRGARVLKARAVIVR